MSDVLLRATGVHKHFPVRSDGLLRREVGARAGGRRRRPRGARRARRSGSSASRAAASRRSRALLLRLTDLTAGTVEFDGRDISALGRGGAAADPARHPDDLPGPVRVAEPAQADRREHRAADADPRRAPARARSPRRCASCSGSSGSRPSTRAATRTSSPAASASGSGSPARSRCGRSSSSPTSRSPRSTSRSRPRSSTCSRTCRRSSGTTYVFVAHDLSVVRQVSDRIAVMYLGKIVEVGPAEDVCAAPGPPVHRGAALRGAGPGSRRRPAASGSCSQGDVPSPADPPSGCRFHTRCRYATEVCRDDRAAARRRTATATSPPATTRGTSRREGDRRRRGRARRGDRRRARGARLGRDGRRAVRARATRAAARATGRACCASATASSGRTEDLHYIRSAARGDRAVAGAGRAVPAGACSPRPASSGSPRTTAARRTSWRGGWTPRARRTSGSRRPRRRRCSPGWPSTTSPSRSTSRTRA